MKQSIFKLDISQMSDTDIFGLRMAINNAFSEYEEFIGKPYLRFESHDHFIQNLSDEDNHFLVIKRLDKFIGGVCFRTPSPDSDTLYFGMLWVAPNERSKGLASLLIQIMEKEAKQRNKKGLLIKLFKIPKLIHYYQELGFNFIDGNKAGPMVKYF
ncbi:GNAT family N-acetyltransferase [Vibrio algarum]|uniref:GNAT family N-acetyltransferase n=1 Tax=Vibrio algarum TaxID=3020714 RepID=A0ABT4YS45_9VIBR|nr:GNAT family N-acetyltransferase [Vibrio sp. KJ40-1]MDB1124026.1 GNAT family N-acetyltransferase [Vibrio sp. KJ40-1]